MSNPKDRCEIYKDGADKWRWRAIAINGRIVAASCQGYVNKSDCVENAERSGYTGCPEV
jgi:uncharacterized protein YegP (UPF0339 family)